MKHSNGLRRLITAAAVIASMVTVLSGCATASPTSSAQSVTVWDYYGQSTPLKEALKKFKVIHPEVKVNYQAFDYQTMQDKFSVAVSSGNAPDLATIDMTWVPGYAANGVLADIASLSGGKLNGKNFASQYNAGANRAMTFDGKTVVAMYDFDAYALYYRKDILDKKGIAVPTTWDEMVTASRAMAEDTNNDGKPDKYALQLLPDTFHFDQLLLQNGGTILTKNDKKAAFNSSAGIGAMDYQSRLLKSGGAIYWGNSEGDSSGLPGIQDERIGMFLNGPYMMGILKDGAASQSGKWAVAAAPISKKQGSYLGGTGLAIPANAHNKPGAWKLAQFLLRPDQQQLVYTSAGAAPATLAGLAEPALSQPDPYFGGQAPFSVFEEAMKTATPYPYVASWSSIDSTLTDASTAVLLGKSSSRQALTDAATTVNAALRK